MPIPDLPEQPNEDCMLSLKFGREVVNYFSGSPLNRLSFLRTDHAFLRAAFSHPTAAILLMNNLSPLVRDASHVAFVSNQDVIPYTGPDPLAKTEEEMIKDFNSEVTQPLILFLGVDENNRLPSNGSDAEPFTYKNYKGVPYFAVDITPRGSLTEAANKVIKAVTDRGLSFHEHTPRHMGLVAPEGKL
jgi:NAD+ diphosphatase